MYFFDNVININKRLNFVSLKRDWIKTKGGKKVEEIAKIINEIGIEKAIDDIEGFFLYLENRRKKNALEQYEETLTEQTSIRYRWKNHQNT